MKKIILLALVCITTKTFAIDRIVQENGPTGTFATISAAITAAADGDRIIIYSKIGDNPYIEDITINKSLEFASAQDGVRYKIQGNIAIQALNNRTVTIIGANLISGSISGSTNGWRTNVNIMGCLLGGGAINFGNQYYVSIISNILLAGNIDISHGKVIGNDLEGQSLSITNSTSLSNDTMNIIANKVSRIFCSSDIFLNVYNNFISKTDNVNTPGFSSIHYTFVSTINKLNIVNNTILSGALNANSWSSISRPIYLRLLSPAVIKNNILQTYYLGALFYYPSYVLTTGSTSSNNYTRDGVTNNTPSPNYYTLLSQIVDTTTGQLILPTFAQNGADPSFEFYDLDLSIGDAGCYGGSYTLDNYFPITGSSRVYNIDMPFGITTTGAPLNIKADGFDR